MTYKAPKNMLFLGALIQTKLCCENPNYIVTAVAIIVAVYVPEGI